MLKKIIVFFVMLAPVNAYSMLSKDLKALLGYNNSSFLSTKSVTVASDSSNVDQQCQHGNSAEGGTTLSSCDPVAEMKFFIDVGARSYLNQAFRDFYAGKDIQELNAMIDKHYSGIADSILSQLVKDSKIISDTEQDRKTILEMAKRYFVLDSTNKEFVCQHGLRSMFDFGMPSSNSVTHISVHESDIFHLSDVISKLFKDKPELKLVIHLGDGDFTKFQSLLQDVKNLVVTGREATSLKDLFLSDCNNLTDVDLSLLHNVTSVGNMFMASCHEVKSLHLPYKLQSVGNLFLLKCSELDELYLPMSLDSVGDFPLIGLEEIKVLYASKKLDKLCRNFINDQQSKISYVKQNKRYSVPQINYYEDRNVINDRWGTKVSLSDVDSNVE